MAYPTTLDTVTPTSGTNLLTSPDHANLHNTLGGSSVVAIETLLGTTPGTNILNPGIKNASDQLVGMNSGGTQNQTWTKGTANNFVMGSQSATGGTFSAPTINGQGTNNGTISGGMYGTATLQGGTINIAVGTIGTLAGGSLTTGNFQLGQFLRLVDNTQNWKIQTGTVIFGTIGTLSNTSSAISFSTPFTTIPIIITSASGGTGAPAAGAYLTSVNDTLGTAGFTFRIANNSTTTTSGTVIGNWVAIGY